MDNSAVTPDISHGLETELKLPACFYRTPLFCLSALFLLELLGEATQRLGAMEFFLLETVFSCVVIFCSLVSFRLQPYRTDTFSWTRRGKVVTKNSSFLLFLSTMLLVFPYSGWKGSQKACSPTSSFGEEAGSSKR